MGTRVLGSVYELTTKTGASYYQDFSKKEKKKVLRVELFFSKERFTSFITFSCFIQHRILTRNAMLGDPTRISSKFNMLRTPNNQ